MSSNPASGNPQLFIPINKGKGSEYHIMSKNNSVLLTLDEIQINLKPILIENRGVGIRDVSDNDINQIIENIKNHISHSLDQTQDPTVSEESLGM